MCRPITTRSRHFSVDDKTCIQSEIVKLLDTGVIEPSSSPWCAQVLVVNNPSQPDKKHLCVNYSQTINQYTELEAYPLPRIDDMINNLGSKRHSLQAVELSQRTQAAVQIVSNLPAPSNGGPIYRFFGQAGHADPLDGKRCCSQKRVMSRPIQVRQLKTRKSGFVISAINKYMSESRYP